MDRNDELYKAGLLLHGHKCPAMPMGLRAGQAALQALGVERATDGQLTALVEIDSDHCATCYAEGVMMATGCTFGKGNLVFKDYGKNVYTIVSRDKNRAVRIAQKFGATAFRESERFRELNRKASLTDDEEAEADPANVELVSLEDAESGEAKATGAAEDEIEIEDDDDSAADETFLEEEEEDNDDVSGLIDGDIEDDEES